ncbi:thioredoxin family protein [Paenibacillus jiagnxiensis]|uniref:thioredoxin family protein n=1 Tax=Paenibacillus jiagnxiensis TaxID=3228926 RepID=UPI0033BF9594
MTIITMTDDNWSDIVGKSDSLLVSFSSPHCPPCRAAEPVMEQLGQELADRLKVAKINVWEHSELASSLGIMATPTFVLFRGGEPTNKMVGYQSRDALFGTIQGWMDAK